MAERCKVPWLLFSRRGGRDESRAEPPAAPRGSPGVLPTCRRAVSPPRGAARAFAQPGRRPCCHLPRHPANPHPRPGGCRRRHPRCPPAGRRRARSIPGLRSAPGGGSPPGPGPLALGVTAAWPPTPGEGVFLGLKTLKLISGHSALQNARPLPRSETPVRRNPGRSRASIPCSPRPSPGTETPPGLPGRGGRSRAGSPGKGGQRPRTDRAPPVPPACRAPSRAPGPAAFRRKADE